MQKKQPNNGFLVVASRKKSFYISAINLIESIKDYYPEAQCCLVVDEHLCDGREEVADTVIFTEVQDDYRAKLWGMAKTPYDMTMYIDADMQCVHEDVVTAFDQLGDNDLMFSKLCKERDVVFKNRYFPAGQFELNGGVCLYNSSKKKVVDFMWKWWTLYTEQLNDAWWPTDPNTGGWDLVNYGKREENKYWDQFTLWWLTHKDPDWEDIKVGIFEDDLRWNYYVSMGRFLLFPTKDPIFEHHSSSLKKDNYEVYKTYE